jgi:hypothetical protein
MQEVCTNMAKKQPEPAPLTESIPDPGTEKTLDPATIVKVHYPALRGRKVFLTDGSIGTFDAEGILVAPYGVVTTLLTLPQCSLIP